MGWQMEMSRLLHLATNLVDGILGHVIDDYQILAVLL